MNKSQLVDSIAKEAKLTKADAKKALEAFMSTTKGALKKGDKISLVGFGTFSIPSNAFESGVTLLINSPMSEVK